MKEYVWWAENQEFVYVENLMETLYNFGILNPDSDEDTDLEWELSHHLWETYHKPYIKNKNKLNPLKIFSGLRSKYELFMARCRDYWS